MRLCRDCGPFPDDSPAAPAVANAAWCSAARGASGQSSPAAGLRNDRAPGTVATMVHIGGRLQWLAGRRSDAFTGARWRAASPARGRANGRCPGAGWHGGAVAPRATQHIADAQLGFAGGPVDQSCRGRPQRRCERNAQPFLISVSRRQPGICRANMDFVTVEGVYCGRSRGEPVARRYVDEVRRWAPGRSGSRARRHGSYLVQLQYHDRTQEPLR